MLFRLYVPRPTPGLLNLFSAEGLGIRVTISTVWEPRLLPFLLTALPLPSLPRFLPFPTVWFWEVLLGASCLFIVHSPGKHIYFCGFKGQPWGSSGAHFSCSDPSAKPLSSNFQPPTGYLQVDFPPATQIQHQIHNYPHKTSFAIVFPIFISSWQLGLLDRKSWYCLTFSFFFCSPSSHPGPWDLTSPLFRAFPGHGHGHDLVYLTPPSLVCCLFTLSPTTFSVPTFILPKRLVSDTTNHGTFSLRILWWLSTVFWIKFKLLGVAHKVPNFVALTEPSTFISTSYISHPQPTPKHTYSWGTRGYPQFPQHTPKFPISSLKLSWLL